MARVVVCGHPRSIRIRFANRELPQAGHAARAPPPAIMVHDPSVGAGRENRSSCAGRNTEQRDTALTHRGGHSELAARRSGDRGRGSLGRRWISPQYYRNIAIVRLSCSSLCSVRWAVGRQLAGRLHRLQQRTVTVRVALAGPGVRNLFRVMFGRVLRGARGYLQEETSAHGRLKCVRYWYQVSCAVDDTAHPRPEVQTYTYAAVAHLAVCRP